MRETASLSLLDGDDGANSFEAVRNWNSVDDPL
jgi:hypothetical protein